MGESRLNGFTFIQICSKIGKLIVDALFLMCIGILMSVVVAGIIASAIFASVTGKVKSLWTQKA
jgi:hypothetical protein